MLGEKGFNELDLNLLNHLRHNEKPLAFVRTQCDKNIASYQDEDEVSKDFACNEKRAILQF